MPLERAFDGQWRSMYRYRHNNFQRNMCPYMSEEGVHCTYPPGHKAHSFHNDDGHPCGYCVKNLYKRNRTPIVRQSKEEPRTHPSAATENPSATS
jgi:hypothetical protein